MNHEAVGNAKRYLKYVVLRWAGAKRWSVKSKATASTSTFLLFWRPISKPTSQLASHLGGLRASLASPAEVDMLTGCVFGAIPPFSFHPNLKLVADPLLFERFDEIAFNAGLLENQSL